MDEIAGRVRYHFQGHKAGMSKEENKVIDEKIMKAKS
jgi:hypothetical protein